MALPDKVSVQTTPAGVSVLLPPAIGGSLKTDIPLKAVAQGADALLLVRNDLGATGYFAGSLSALSLGEVFGHIHTGTRNGTLMVSSASSRRTVDFRDGQIVFATSSEPHERLGALLVKRGWVSRAKLDAALSKVKEGTKIGQVLTRSREISPATLYNAMTVLVQEIVINLFELAQGDFLFLEGTSLAEDALKLPQGTRAIVLDGIKRGEELERLRRRFPDSTRVALGKGQAPEGSHSLLSRVGLGGELSALRPLFEGSEYAFLSWIEVCLASGALVPRASTRPSPPRTKPEDSTRRSALQLYATLIQTICGALKAAGQDLSDLQSFFRDPLPGMEEAFGGVQLSADGQLDLERVIKNMGDTPIRRARAYEALDSFMSYALFSAKNVMPADRADALAKECRRMQAGLRQ